MKQDNKSNLINNLHIVAYSRNKEDENFKPFTQSIILEKYHYELYKLYQLDRKERHIIID